MRTAGFCARASLLFAMALLVTPLSGSAHPLDPAILRVTASEAQRYRVVLRRPVSWPRSVAPRWPSDCVAVEREPRLEGDVAVDELTLSCRAPLAGRAIGLTGLAERGLACLVVVEPRDGPVQHGVLAADAPVFTIAATPTFWTVCGRYFALGAEHLWLGADHLLFLLGVALTTLELRKTAWLLTAFTAGHSVTLAAAALGAIRLPSALVEVAIALSLVVLALELLNAAKARLSGPLCAAFGLLHGLGFASALGGAGLARGQLVPSLLSFNLGIEAAQLLSVIALLPALYALRRASHAVAMRARVLCGYVIGSAGAMWCIERGLAFF